jgi:GNAT superfamily N-acetyltransferase
MNTLATTGHGTGSRYISSGASKTIANTTDVTESRSDTTGNTVSFVSSLGPELRIRPFELGGRETGFVLDSWSRAVARDPIWRVEVGRRGVARTPIPPSLSLYYHDIILKKILTNCTLLVACDPEDPDVIWGYVAFDQVDPVLHFVYVKGAFRRMGIGTRLMEEAFDRCNGSWSQIEDHPVVVSHRTESLFKAWPQVKWRWNPYRMMV